MQNWNNCVSRRGAVLTGALILALGCGAVATSAAGGKNDSSSKVKVKASATKIDNNGNQIVTLDLSIADGWYIYANPVGNDDLAETATSVKITADAEPKAVKVIYPKGTVKIDTIVGNYNIYKEKATIKALVQRAPGSTGPLNVSLNVNSCDKNMCLPPGEIKLKVE